MKKTKSKIVANNKSQKYLKFKRKVKNLTLYFLENMLDSMEDLGRMSMSRKEAYRCFYQNREYEWRDSALGKWLQNLKQRGLIKIEKKGNTESVIFTNKAKIKLIEKIVTKRKADKLYRFISFDIPERLRSRRNRFRSIIKKIGFIQIQKSLWVIDRDVTDMVELASYDCKVEQYLAYIASSKSDIDGYIDKLFKAKRVA